MHTVAPAASPFNVGGVPTRQSIGRDPFAAHLAHLRTDPDFRARLASLTAAEYAAEVARLRRRFVLDHSDFVRGAARIAAAALDLANLMMQFVDEHDASEVDAELAAAGLSASMEDDPDAVYGPIADAAFETIAGFAYVVEQLGIQLVGCGIDVPVAHIPVADAGDDRDDDAEADAGRAHQ